MTKTKRSRSSGSRSVGPSAHNRPQKAKPRNSSSRPSTLPRVVGWPQRIAAATKRGGFTAKDRADSETWQTCACGRLDAAIPRFKISLDAAGPLAPKDDALRELGSEFMTAVGLDEFTNARDLIQKITVRAAEILRSKP